MFRHAIAAVMLTGLLGTPGTAAAEAGFALAWEFAGPDLRVRIRNSGGGGATPSASTTFALERDGRALPQFGRKGALAPIPSGGQEFVTVRNWRRLAPGIARFCVFPSEGATAKMCIQEALPGTKPVSEDRPMLRATPPRPVPPKPPDKPTPPPPGIAAPAGEAEPGVPAWKRDTIRKSGPTMRIER